MSTSQSTRMEHQEGSVTQSHADWLGHWAARIANAVREVSGESSSTALAVDELIQQSNEAWGRIAGNRSFKIPAIALIGERNAGKSQIARLLVSDPDAQQRIGVGEDECNKTETLVWIGPQRPDPFYSGSETYIRVAAGSMCDVGTAYVLLDTPGMDDCSQQMKELYRSSLNDTPYKVCVLTSASLASELIMEDAALGDGSLILPVVRLSGSETTEIGKEAARIRTSVETALEDYRARMPHARILPAVLLPDLEANDGRSHQERELEVVGLISSGIRQMLEVSSTGAGSRLLELEAVRERLRISVSSLLAPLFREVVVERHASLQRRIDGVSGRSVEFLLKDAQRLDGLFRREFRIELMNRLPVWAFPFRSVVGMLCYTTGAWDRLALAAAGSLPSLLLTGYAAAKEVKNQSDAAGFLRAELKSHLTGFISDDIGREIEEFLASLERSLELIDPEKSSGKSSNTWDYDLSGVSELAAEWQRQIVHTTSEHPFRGITLFALMATAIFSFLVLAPVVHLYGQYVPAAIGSWSAHWSPEDLGQYPAPDFGFWTMAVVLSTLPVAVIAMILVSLTLSRRRTKACLADFERRVKEASNGIGFAVRIKEPRFEAARLLINEICRIG